MHDYPEIVKRPMDFSTIKKSLQKGGKYETYEDLFADVQLIWDNCKTYNIQGSDIYKQAEYMEKVSKKQVNKFKEEVGMGGAGAKKKKPAPAASKEEGKRGSGAQEGDEDEEEEQEVDE